MFPQISAFFVISLAVVTTARMQRRMHVRRDNTTSAGQCDSGNVQCCNAVDQAENLAYVLDLLSYSYDPADSVGIDCTPLNVYGAGEGAACQAQPVCCSNNSYTGSINIGCSPFDLN